MTAPVRVVLVEDQALVRAGFRALIDGADDLVVVGEAASGVEGIAVVAEQRPDVALVDIQLPGMDGVAAMRVMLRQARHPLRVVALTAFDDEDTVMAALRAGASGFLLKDLTPDALLDAVRTVARGDALIAPQVTRMLIERALTPAPERGAAALEGLTDREREVLALIAAGRSNEEIAEHLVVAGSTVKTHVRNLLAKTGARDRAQLVVLAYESGLVQPGGATARG